MTLLTLYLTVFVISIPLQWLYMDHDHACIIRRHANEPWELLDYEIEMVHQLLYKKADPQRWKQHRRLQVLFTVAVSGVWFLFWPVCAYGWWYRMRMRHQHLRDLARTCYGSLSCDHESYSDQEETDE